MVVKINPGILLPNSRKKGELAVKKINYDIDAENILIIAVMALMIALGIVVLTGMEDWLIAGYNTASKK